MADLKAFAEQLVSLTVKEVNELAKILKDEYGIEPAAAAVAVAAGPAAGPAAVVEEKTAFDAFHLYPMKQAIEEEFILDVLQNYTTYNSFYKLIKAVDDASCGWNAGLCCGLPPGGCSRYTRPRTSQLAQPYPMERPKCPIS